MTGSTLGPALAYSDELAAFGVWQTKPEVRAVRAFLAVGASGVEMRRQLERVDEAVVRALVHERHHRAGLAPRRDAQLLG